MEQLLSVIIPSYNEEAMIPRTAATIADLLHAQKIPYELIFVDDGSADATWERIQLACEENRCVRGISFSRNFGKDPAIFAGLSAARGDCAVVIDCDLQHPPETLVQMYRLWQQGYEIVEGVKSDRGKESFLHRLCANSFYRLIGRASGIDMRRASDFKLLDRKAIDALLALPEQDAFFRALSSWIGFRKTQVDFEVRERTEGVSKWSLGSLIRYAVSSITSFSGAPMYAALWVGVLSLVCALAGGIGCVLTGGAWMLFLQIATLVSLSAVLICLCVIGYYIDKLCRQGRNRPRYIISKSCGE